MMSKRDRRPRHLAAADYLIGVAGDENDDVIEVIAAHLLDAYQAVPGRGRCRPTCDSEPTRPRSGPGNGQRRSVRTSRRSATTSAQQPWLTMRGTQAELIEKAGLYGRVPGQGSRRVPPSSRMLGVASKRRGRPMPRRASPPVLRRACGTLGGFATA